MYDPAPTVPAWAAGVLTTKASIAAIIASTTLTTTDRDTVRRAGGRALGGEVPGN
ncbi:hypothetical protein Aple_012540 [Acrocarpospora pleiomorpha]|uniref:Uncharacterized protein n=1 Tax=Acrocarpospora pleiomorpha TaxID=90975 RepID=A0A5M3XDV3_9ACTN|nr:hypothetical protein Aple_012540 [Acrocarpospora pleiomorpha]